MPQLRLRPATASDVPAIAALHTTSWRDAYAALLDPDFLAGPIEADRLDVWEKRLRDTDADQVVQVAESGDREVVGFVCAFPNADPAWGSLVDNLHVAPHMRGNKVGEKLLRSAAASLASRGAHGGLFLWVFEANTAGLRFYERLGGRVVGQDVSRIAAANGKTSLRVHWPSLQDVAHGAG
ncbi:MAG: N-acetyltransferase family protein [Phenylobacterium sp.]